MQDPSHGDAAKRNTQSRAMQETATTLTLGTMVYVLLNRQVVRNHS